jgi:hypothetical protein
MRRLHMLLVGICLPMVGCGFNTGAMQGSPVVEYHGVSQSRVETRGSDQVLGSADRADSLETAASEITLSNLGTGNVSKVVFDKSVGDATITIHNGSDISVRLQTDSNVTGVIVDGDALTRTPLRRINSGHWQGSFHYWDASNTPKSKTRMTVLFISARSSIRRALLVTTVHDS